MRVGSDLLNTVLISSSFACKSVGIECLHNKDCIFLAIMVNKRYDHMLTILREVLYTGLCAHNTVVQSNLDLTD